MTNHLYLYVDDNDIDEIVTTILSLGGFFIAVNDNKFFIPTLQSIKNLNSYYYVFPSDQIQCLTDRNNEYGLDNCIICNNMENINGYLQPMHLALPRNNLMSNQKRKIDVLFSKFKKYIKNNFVLSTNKDIYMGRFAYDLWKKREFRAGLFLERRESIVIDDLSFDRFIKWAKANDYILINYTVYSYNFKGKVINDREKFLITTKKSKLYFFTNRLGFNVYDADKSECIFLTRDLTKKRDLKIEVDERLFEENVEIMKLYFDVINFFKS